jgi:hypothetical protein
MQREVVITFRRILILALLPKIFVTVHVLEYIMYMAVIQEPRIL